MVDKNYGAGKLILCWKKKCTYIEHPFMQHAVQLPFGNVAKGHQQTRIISMVFMGKVILLYVQVGKYVRCAVSRWVGWSTLNMVSLCKEVDWLPRLLLRLAREVRERALQFYVWFCSISPCWPCRCVAMTTFLQFQLLEVRITAGTGGKPAQVHIFVFLLPFLWFCMSWDV